MADLEIEVDLPDGASERWKRLAEEGGQDAVDQITVLAEAAMKEEAPEGAGIPEVHMRDTIKPTMESRNPYSKVVKPHKMTEQGWPLHHVIIEGTTGSSYSGPPPLPPLVQWAEAKLSGDPVQAAQNIRWAIAQEGHETFPNPFIDRSIRQWQNRADEIAQEAVDEAFEGGGL